MKKFNKAIKTCFVLKILYWQSYKSMNSILFPSKRSDYIELNLVPLVSRQQTAPPKRALLCMCHRLDDVIISLEVSSVSHLTLFSFQGIFFLALLTRLQLHEHSEISVSVSIF